MDERMRQGTVEQESPRGWLRLFLRLPIVFYRLGLGWLFGHRFLLLVHTGRKSGRSRSTVLEVLRFDPHTHACIIASGWGTRAQWYRNVLQQPQIRFVVGVHERAGRAAQLTIERAEQELRDYGARHRAAIRRLTRMMIGEEFSDSPALYLRLASKVPVLELQPRAEGG